MKETNPTNDRSNAGLPNSFRQQLIHLNNGAMLRREKHHIVVSVRMLFLGILIGALCSLWFK